MIQFVEVLLKEVFAQGRKFSWEQPSKCPRCNHYKVWGHGYVSALFDNFNEPLWLKRYRCPSCGCVILMRPASHFSRFQSSRKTINSALEQRINHGRWPPDMPLSLMRHWLANLKRQVKAHLPQTWKSGLMAAYDHLVGMEKVPVSSLI